MARPLTLTIQINADGSAAIRDVRRLTDETGRLGNAGDRAGTLASAGLNKIAAAAASLVGAGALATAFLEANIAADRLAASLTAVTGSTTAAGREMAYLAEVADRLGLDVSSAATAYLSLSAAAKGTTLEGAKTRAIFEAISLAMAKLGKSADETQGALLAIEQMISKGKVSAEELRQQLGERLPGAFGAAAAAMGVTTAELDQLLSTGQVTADELLPKLAARLNALYDDGEQIGGLTAEWNRMTTAFKGLAVAIDDATGLTGALEFALRQAGEVIDSIRWAVDYLDKGVNPDKLAAALSAGAFGYENLRTEADRLYSLILAKQEEIYRLSQQLDQSGWFGRAGVQRELETSQGQLLELAQRLGDVKTALTEMDQQQDQTWSRQRASIEQTDQAVGQLDASMQTYATRAANLLTNQGDSAGRVASEIAKILPVVDEMAKKYGIAREVILGVIAQESGFNRLAESTAGALGYMQIMPATAREIEQALGMAAGTIERDWNANIEAGTYYLAKMIEKFGSLEKALHAYNAGPGNALKGILPEETQRYIPAVMANIERLIPLLGKGSEALKLFGTAGQAAGRDIQAGLDPATVAMERALDRAEQLARQYLPARAAAQDYAEAQAVLAVAVAKGTLAQTEAAEVLEKLRARTQTLPADTATATTAWAKVWESAVERIDDAFANLWLDLFTGTKSTLETLKAAVLRWLAELAHELITKKLVVQIAAVITGSAGASVASAATSVATGGGGLGGIGGIGSWFGGTSIGTSLGLGMAQSSLFTWVPTKMLTNLMAVPNIALGVGAIGGMLAGSWLGDKSAASQLGSTIGSTAGTVIGGMIAGPIGAILGGVLGGGGGGFLGKLFGGGKKEKTPNPWAAIDVAQGQLRLLNSNEMDAAAIQQALDQVNREMDAVARMLGDAATEWRQFYNHTSFHLTSAESIDSMIRNIVQWQLTHMIAAMKSDEVARAGSALLGEIIGTLVDEAGSDPQAAVAAIGIAKALFRSLRDTVDRLFVFTADGALFASIEDASTTLWDLAVSMQQAGESAASALNRVMAAMSNLSLTDRLNASLQDLALDDTALAALTEQKYAYLDQAVIDAERALAEILSRSTQTLQERLVDTLLQVLPIADTTSAPSISRNVEAGLLGRLVSSTPRTRLEGTGADAVSAAEEALAAALRGTTRTVQRVVEINPGGQEYWGDNYGGFGEIVDRSRREWREIEETITEVSQEEVAAAQRRLEEARRLAATTERVLTEEEIQAEILRRRIEIMEDLAELAGGQDALAALQNRYYEVAFTEAERAADQARYAQGKINDLNRSITASGYAGGPVDSIASLREYIETLDLTTDAGQAAYIEALRAVDYFTLLDEALAALNPDLEDTTRRLEELARQEAALAEKRAALELRLIEIEQGSEAALAERRRRELAAADPSLRPRLEEQYALEDQVRILEDSVAAAEAHANALAQIEAQRADIEIELIRLTQGEEAALAEQRRRELAAVDESLRPLLERQHALEDEARAAETAAQAAEAAAQRMEQVQQARADLELRMLELTEGTAARVAEERRRELEAADATLRPLLERIYGLEDEAAAMEAATAATEEQARRVAEIEARRADIELDLIRLTQGEEAALAEQRRRELAAVDESLRPLLLRQYALEDEARAAEAAAQAAEAAAQRMEQVQQARADLELRLLELTEGTAARVAEERRRELEAADATLRPLLERIYGLEDEAAAMEAATAAAEEQARRIAEIEARRADIELELIRLTQGEEAALAEQRRRELAAVDESLRPLLERQHALEDEARAAETAAQAAEAAAQRMEQVQQARADLELRMLELTEGTAARVAEERRRELEAADATLRPLLERIYLLEDEAAAMEQAARAIEERADLELRLLRASGNETEALARERAAELAAVDASNRAILERIYALEDEAAAVERAREAARVAYQDLEAAVAAERAAIDATANARISALESERAAAEAAASAQREAAQAQREAAQEALASAESVLGVITGAVDNLRGQQPVTELDRARAARQLAGMAAGRRLPDQEQLERVLEVLTRSEAQDYATETAYRAAEQATYANLLKLQGMGEREVDQAQATVDRLDRQLEQADAAQQATIERLDRQIESAQAWREAELARLDDLLDTAATQLEVYEGTYRAVLSLDTAMARFTSALGGVAAPDAVIGPEVPAPLLAASQSQVDELRALRNEMATMRSDLATIGTAQVIPLRAIEERLRAWDLDGQPGFRDDGDGSSIVLLQAG